MSFLSLPLSSSPFHFFSFSAEAMASSSLVRSHLSAHGRRSATGPLARQGPSPLADRRHNSCTSAVSIGSFATMATTPSRVRGEESVSSPFSQPLLLGFLSRARQPPTSPPLCRAGQPSPAEPPPRTRAAAQQRCRRPMGALALPCPPSRPRPMVGPTPPLCHRPSKPLAGTPSQI